MPYPGLILTLRHTDPDCSSCLCFCCAFSSYVWSEARDFLSLLFPFLVSNSYAKSTIFSGTLAHNNGEDWAAKARAWAAAQTSSDNQYTQSQYTSFGRTEENQFSMANPQYSDSQHFPVAASSYQQYQASVAPPYQSSESSFSSGYIPDGHLPFNGRNGSLVGEPNCPLPHQESSPLSVSVHQQEVPSSYSSVTGNNLIGILILSANLVHKKSNNRKWTCLNVQFLPWID